MRVTSEPNAPITNKNDLLLQRFYDESILHRSRPLYSFACLAG